MFSSIPEKLFFILLCTPIHLCIVIYNILLYHRNNSCQWHPTIVQMQSLTCNVRSHAIPVSSTPRMSDASIAGLKSIHSLKYSALSLSSSQSLWPAFDKSARSGSGSPLWTIQIRLVQMRITSLNKYRILLRRRKASRLTRRTASSSPRSLATLRNSDVRLESRAR